MRYLILGLVAALLCGACTKAPVPDKPTQAEINAVCTDAQPCDEAVAAQNVHLVIRAEADALGALACDDGDASCAPADVTVDTAHLGPVPPQPVVYVMPPDTGPSFGSQLRQALLHEAVHRATGHLLQRLRVNQACDAGNPCTSASKGRVQPWRTIQPPSLC